jgi:hypothetical protein
VLELKETNEELNDKCEVLTEEYDILKLRSHSENDNARIFGMGERD